jgi:DNA-binding SARP family transcriptional activator
MERGAPVPAPRGEGTPSDGGLRVRVLGDVTAIRADQPLDLGGPRQRALLARLVVGRGSIVSTDQLADALWPTEPPPTSIASLQTYVSHLRRRLQPERAGRDRGGIIASVSGGYALRLPTEAVDAWRFEQLLAGAGAEIGTDPAAAVAGLREALALWRGPAYTGHGEQAWAEAEIARLSELRAVAGEQLLAARLGAGESALLVPELELLVDQDPLREERWRLLVLALYRSGRQADALAALRRARDVLAEELGVDPGPALRTLEAEVLAQAPTLDAAIPDPRARPVNPVLPGHASSTTGLPGAAGTPNGSPRPARARRLRDELVERDHELAELGNCLADAMDEQGHLALVTGPAGIGKSRLLAEARHLADEAGALLLAARCSELEREFGFGAVRQLFEPLLADATRRDVLLRGSAEAAGPAFGLGAGHDLVAEESSFATLHGLYWMTVNLAGERPLVLAVDDLQWCDSGSLRFLNYLVRRLEGLPVLVLATMRTGEEPAEAQLLEELRFDAATVPIRLGPLSPAGLRRMVAGALGSPPDQGVVGKRAGRTLILGGRQPRKRRPHRGYRGAGSAVSPGRSRTMAA